MTKHMAGEIRSERIPAEIATLIEAYLLCFAANHEHAELTRVDDGDAMAKTAGPATDLTCYGRSFTGVSSPPRP